mgnify:CR=1 FL=1
MCLIVLAHQVHPRYPLIVAANRFPGQREALLHGVQLRLADLPDGLVGIAHGTTIYLDQDGGGHGWFIDPTPLVDEEFVNGMAKPAGRLIILLNVDRVVGIESALPAQLAAMGLSLDTIRTAIVRRGTPTP